MFVAGARIFLNQNGLVLTRNLNKKEINILNISLSSKQDTYLLIGLA